MYYYEVMVKGYQKKAILSSISSDDVNLELPGYNLVRVDNTTNTKRGGIRICYHNSLPLKVIDIQFLNECITFEMRIGGKPHSFLCLYFFVASFVYVWVSS